MYVPPNLRYNLCRETATIRKRGENYPGETVAACLKTGYCLRYETAKSGSEAYTNAAHVLHFIVPTKTIANATNSVLVGITDVAYMRCEVWRDRRVVFGVASPTRCAAHCVVPVVVSR